MEKYYSTIFKVFNEIVMNFSKKIQWQLNLQGLTREIGEEDKNIDNLTQTNNGGNWSLFEKLESEIDLNDNEIDRTIFWNESVENLKKIINEDLEDWKVQKSNEILKKADAGNSFEDKSEWVIPFSNLDNETYEQVRNSDLFKKIIMSQDNLQFTREKGQDNWIRLIMPKNTRRVEVEDLNRNFWVIGQSISLITEYLLSNNSPLPKALAGTLSEISQLWENLGFLWLTSYSLIQNPITKIRTLFIPITPYFHESYSPQSKNRFAYREYQYDNMDYTYNFKDWQTFLVSYGYEYVRALMDSYTDTNLIIVPYLRNNNYEKNYFSEVIFLGMVIVDRNLKWSYENGNIANSEMKFINFTYSSNNSAINTPPSFTIRNPYPLNYGAKIARPFSTFNEETNQEEMVILDDCLYCFRETENGYRIAQPFSRLYDISEREPGKYYAALRFIPNIKAHYERGIVIDKFEIQACDAVKAMINGENKPLISLEFEGFNVKDFKNNSLMVSMKKCEPAQWNELDFISQPWDLQADNQKLYLGENVSWYGYSVLPITYEIGETESLGVQGYMVKIGQFMCDNYGLLETDNSGWQGATSGGTKIMQTGHQYHEVSDNEFEKTNYLLNLNFKKLNTDLKGEEWSSNSTQNKSCYYYINLHSYKNSSGKQCSRWILEKSENDNYPTKEEIRDRGYETITQLLLFGKDLLNPDSTNRYFDEQGYNSTDEIGNGYEDIGFDLNKMIYFTSAYGIRPWHNQYQFYWSHNVLFGIYLYIPEDYYEIYNKKYQMNFGDGHIIRKDNEVKGYLFYVKDINRVERAFQLLNENGQLQDCFYVPNGGTTWRLPKLLADQKTYTAVKEIKKQDEVVVEEKFVELDDELDYIIKTGNQAKLKAYFENLQPNEKVSQEDFIADSVNKMKNNFTGYWTVFDGNVNDYKSNNIDIYNDYSSDYKQVLQSYFYFNSDNEPYLDRIYYRFLNEEKWNYKERETQDSPKLNSDNIPLTANPNDSDTKVQLETLNGIVNTDKVLNLQSLIWISSYVSYEQKETENIIYPSYENHFLKTSVKQGFLISEKNQIVNVNDIQPFDFTLLCAGKRVFNGTIIEDSKFRNYCEIFKNYNKGIYFISNGTTIDQIQEEAGFLVSLLDQLKNSGINFTYPIYIGFEDYSVEKDNSLNPEFIYEFLNTLIKADYYCGLYVRNKQSLLACLESQISVYKDFINNLIKDNRILYINNKALYKIFDEETGACSFQYTHVLNEREMNFANEGLGMWQWSDGTTNTLPNRNFSGFDTSINPVSRVISFINYAELIGNAEKEIHNIVKW